MGIRAFRDLGGQWSPSIALLSSALLIAGPGGREAAAVRSLGAAESVCKSAGIGRLPIVSKWLEEALASLRTQLTPSRFVYEWRSGQEMTVTDAVDTALDELASSR